MSKLLILFAVLSLALACGGSSDASSAKSTTEQLTAGDYAQNCNVDADCVAVYQGEVCGSHCSCANAAIAKSAYDAYETASKDAVAACAAPSLNACNCVATYAKCDTATKTCQFQ